MVQSGRDIRAAPRAPAARGPKRRFLTPARSRGAPWARSRARGGVGAWASETPVVSAHTSAARVAFVSSGRDRLFIDGRARARTRTSSPKRDPKRPAQRTPPRSATPASAPPRDTTPEGSSRAHPRTPRRPDARGRPRKPDRSQKIYGFLRSPAALPRATGGARRRNSASGRGSGSGARGAGRGSAGVRRRGARGAGRAEISLGWRFWKELGR